MTYPLLIAGAAAAALFLPGCDWFSGEEESSQVPEGPEPPKVAIKISPKIPPKIPPPVKERKEPLILEIRCQAKHSFFSFL